LLKYLFLSVIFPILERKINLQLKYLILFKINKKVCSKFHKRTKVY